MNKAPSLETLDAPAELKALRQWLCWRYQKSQDPEILKPLKMPYYAKSGRVRGVQNTDTDRAQLVTFDEAKSAALKGNYTGIGLAFIKGCPVTGLDFDHCVTDGAIDPQVEEATLGTYTEISPSGTGIRAFVRAQLGNSKDRHEDGADLFGFELYNTTGFLTFTGNVTKLCALTSSDGTVATPNAALTELCATRFNRTRSYEAYEGSDEPRQGLTDQQLQQLLAQRDPSCGYHEWKDIGMAIHHETQGEGLWIWDEWSANGAKYPGPDAMAAKWASYGQRHDGKLITAGSLLKHAREQGHEFDAISEDEFDVLPDEPKKPGGHFGITSMRDFLLQVRETKWLVKNFLPLAQLGVLFGESGSGKSFLAFDMAAAIARGVEWNGYRVNQGRVLYVVAEGRNGFVMRNKAYNEFHGLDDFAMDFIHDVIPNLGNATDVRHLIEDMQQLGPFDLVILDTFAQVTGGINENSGEDMGKALGHCKKISLETGAMVLLVHHSGKDASKGARGWSGMKAAADAELEVVASNALRSVRVTKLKDGQEGAEHLFSLKSVVLGKDIDGDDIASCVVEYNGSGGAKRSKKDKLGPRELMILDVLNTVAGFDGGDKVPRDTLIAQVMSQIAEPKRNDKQNVTTSLEGLVRKNRVCIDADGYVSAKNTDLI